MLPGFEFETQPLTAYETNKLLPAFVRCLRCKTGKANAVTSSQIIAGFKKYSIRIDGPRVRKIINHIRINDLVPGLIASSEGYYIATTEQEIDEHEKSLEGREKAIRAVRQSIHRKRMKLYHQPKTENTLF